MMHCAKYTYIPRCVCVSNRPWHWHWHIVFGYSNVFGGILGQMIQLCRMTQRFFKLIFPKSWKILQIPPQEVFGPPYKGFLRRCSGFQTPILKRYLEDKGLYIFKWWLIDPIPQYYPSPIILGLYFGMLPQRMTKIAFLTAAFSSSPALGGLLSWWLVEKIPMST